MQAIIRISLFYLLIAGFITLSLDIHALVKNDRTHFTLMSCEEEAFANSFTNGENAKDTAKMISLCIEKAFQDKQSSCLLNVQYTHDKTRQDNHLPEDFQTFFYTNLKRKGLFDKCMQSKTLEEGNNLDFKLYQLKTLTICIEDENFIPAIKSFESAKELSSCMLNAGHGESHLEYTYNTMKDKMKERIVIEKICTSKLGDEEYNWCAGLSELYRNIKEEASEYIDINVDTDPSI